MTKVCHALVAKTAKEITEAAWEIMSSDDDFHRVWPKVGGFVAAHWRDFIGHARASLAVMLTPTPGTEKDPDGPKYPCSQWVRDQVEEALITEGAFKHVPMPTAADILRYGGMQ